MPAHRWSDPRTGKEWKVQCVGGLSLEAPPMGMLEEEPTPWGLMFEDEKVCFWVETGPPLKPNQLNDHQLQKLLDQAMGRRIR